MKKSNISKIIFPNKLSLSKVILVPSFQPGCMSTSNTFLFLSVDIKNFFVPPLYNVSKSTFISCIISSLFVSFLFLFIVVSFVVFFVVFFEKCFFFGEKVCFLFFFRFRYQLLIFVNINSN